MNAQEIAKRYLVEQYLLQEPDYMSMTEWLDEENDTIVFDGDDSEIHDAVLALLDTVAQRLANEDE